MSLVRIFEHCDHCPDNWPHRNLMKHTTPCNETNFTSEGAYPCKKGTASHWQDMYGNVYSVETMRILSAEGYEMLYSIATAEVRKKFQPKKNKPFLIRNMHIGPPWMVYINSQLHDSTWHELMHEPISKEHYKYIWLANFETFKEAIDWLDEKGKIYA